jgi:hypothetical protein
VAVKDRGMTEGALVQVENDLMDHDFFVENPEFGGPMHRIIEQADQYFAIARKRVFHKISARKKQMADALDCTIDAEIDKIKASFDRKIAELEDREEILEAQHKWYGRNLRGTITRTKNLIAKARSEREFLLRKYRSYLDIECSVELVCAGIVMSVPD